LYPLDFLKTQKNCPVSKALNAAITMNAQLEA